ncbi:A-kinase anchor protein 14 [Schistosoma japonicum]|nr:A-kinase anchor protein 14 [Schistosoma japonicum]
MENLSIDPSKSGEISDKSPTAIRNLIALIIQSSLYHVYEEDVLHNKLVVKPEDLENWYGVNSTDNSHYNFGKLNTNENPDEITEEVILADNPFSFPDIQWPTAEEFTPELGLKEIEKYINCWEISKKWLYYTDILPIVESKNDTLYKYKVKLSLPCRRSPIQKSTYSKQTCMNHDNHANRHVLITQEDIQIPITFTLICVFSSIKLITNLQEKKYIKKIKYISKESLNLTEFLSLKKFTFSLRILLHTSIHILDNVAIRVYYQVETCRSIHIPGKTRFSERWLLDVIRNKMRLMSHVDF